MNWAQIASVLWRLF